uniref:Uncharacterized protein n=1 Tax=Panagrolaimus superbus TaxID=310955 RepID=A0A914ZDW2_9BILA
MDQTFINWDLPEICTLINEYLNNPSNRNNSMQIIADKATEILKVKVTKRNVQTRIENIRRQQKPFDSSKGSSFSTSAFEIMKSKIDDALKEFSGDSGVGKSEFKPPSLNFTQNDFDHHDFDDQKWNDFNESKKRPFAEEPGNPGPEAKKQCFNGDDGFVEVKVMHGLNKI